MLNDSPGAAAKKTKVGDGGRNAVVLPPFQQI